MLFKTAGKQFFPGLSQTPILGLGQVYTWESTLSVKLATAAQLQTVANTMTMAFAADPFNRWYLAEADRYLEHFPKIVEALATPAIAAEACYLTDNHGGAAIWYPPGVTLDEALAGEIFGNVVPAEIGDTFFKVMEAFDTYHPHDDDCWYLPLIGVDAGMQGKGLGGTLMNHVVTLLDEKGALGYLESSNPQNIPLYQRYGFEIMGRIEFEGAPLVTPMLRPRSN